MISFPNCKINLGLYVTQKRPDGYHDIETIFLPVQLKDVLEIVPSTETKLVQTGLPVAGNVDDNLVWKAYKLLSAYFPTKIPTLDIYLHKVIPMGAGMGGGSADGSFMLRLLNDYCQLKLTDEQLAALALQLGSDCPFFIYNTPQFATGRGELMIPIELSLSSYSIQLICPKVHVSTAAAFSAITPHPAPYDLRQLHTLAIEQWKEYVTNDFEEGVFLMHPVLANIKQQLYEQGALYAAMSGTGSTVFGIFPKIKKATITAEVAFEDFYME